MKKAIILFTLCVSASIAVNGQGFTGPSAQGNYATDGGIITQASWYARTSIGASWGGTDDLLGTGYVGFNISHDGPSNQYKWNYKGDGSVANGGCAIIGTTSGSMLFVIKPSTGISGGDLSNTDIKGMVKLRLTDDGRMIIGKSYVSDALNTPGDYKLYVETGILTEKIRVAVKNTGDWADYVFDKDYRLMPLPQLEKYIIENKHLPNIPSAREVVENGVDLQKMDAKLLQKVEELTLMVIQQQKQIDKLKKQIL